jgi:Zn-dependent peptidase ImmA (M78 family)/DNA-binding XRE family transcriptional regulator
MGSFNSALLKLAREAKGWTQAQLAEEADIAQSSISKYEKGLMAPGEAQLAALAHALGVPAGYFAQVDARPAAVLYRSRALRSARKEAKVRARLNLARLVAQRLLDDITVQPVARFPDPDRAYADAEAAAKQLRAGWWLPPGPVENVSEAIEAAGGIVLRVDLGSDEVDAAYLHPLGDPVRWFFVNTRVDAGDRVRFSLAHELGHAIVHDVDFHPDTKQAEDQSNRFAGAFLIPADELRAELPRGRLRVAHLLDLKQRWRVSMGAIAMRARQINAISRDELTRIWREIGWRGMRTSEPGAVEVEHPQILSHALAIQRSEHGLSDAQLGLGAGVHVSTLADLFPEHFSVAAPRHLSVVSGRPR